MRAQGPRKVLTEIPAASVAVVIDDADLIEAQTIDAVFVQKELRVVDQECPSGIGLKIEDYATRPSIVRKVKRVPPQRHLDSILPVEECLRARSRF